MRKIKHVGRGVLQKIKHVERGSIEKNMRGNVQNEKILGGQKIKICDGGSAKKNKICGEEGVAVSCGYDT